MLPKNEIKIILWQPFIMFGDICWFARFGRNIKQKGIIHITEHALHVNTSILNEHYYS